MLTKGQARAFFVVGTGLCSVAFLGLTVDTLRQIPEQTREADITPAVIHGKELWEENNCMGCHTLFGEGAYYAPELTLVYERRGEPFIRAMLRDPEAMYPGERRMEKYAFTPEEEDALVAFLKWAGTVDLNGFPAKPVLGGIAVEQGTTGEGGVATSQKQPHVYNQMCIACHALKGQGGVVGPALDGIGARQDAAWIRAWLLDPNAVKPGARMPKLPLTEEQVNELVAFLSYLKE